MTVRKDATPSSVSCQNHGDTLKDEIYRRMFRLEANRPGAELDLATALLRGWLGPYSTPEATGLLEWLRKVTPLCLTMIEARQQPCDVCREQRH